MMNNGKPPKAKPREVVFLFLILIFKILVELVCSEEYKKNSDSAYKNKQYPVPPGGELIEGNKGQPEDD